MAGGSSSRKEGGSLDNATLKQCHHHHHHQYRQQQRYRHSQHSSNVINEPPPLSQCFKKRQKIECERTYLQSVKTLERDIFRIFTECRNSDFYIIHGCSIVKTNNCIVRTRSPQLYKILEANFVHSNNIIKCYIETPEIFQRIKDFSRLLYSNLDVAQEERILVKFILTVKRNFVLEENICPDYTFFHKERTCKDISCPRVDLVAKIVKKEENGTNDLSPSTSDMADSGLETGSLSPLENTESENSVTDLEDSHATDYVSMDDDFIKISLNGEIEKFGEKKSIAFSSCRPSTSNDRHNSEGEYESLIKSGQKEIPRETRVASAGCSSRKPEQPDFNAHYGTARMENTSKDSHETAKTTTTTMMMNEDENIDEVARYEAEVLSEPFYESDCASNENEPTNSFIPTGSFEFVEPTIMSPTTSDPRRDANRYETFNKMADEKLCPNHEARSMTVEELRHELSHSNDQALKKSSSSISNYYFIDASSLNDEDEIASLSNLVAKEMRDSHGNLTIYTSSTGNYVPTRTVCNAMNDEQNHKLTSRKLSTRQDGHERVAEFERELKMTEYLKPLIEPRKVKRVDSINDDKMEAGTERGIEKETLVVEIKEADSGESTHPSPCTDNNANAKKLHDSTKNYEKKDKTINREIEIIEDRRSSLIRRNTFELDPNDEKLSVLRQEYERRQGHLLFQNSIPQYSGHRVDGDSCFEPPNEETPVVAEVITKFSVDLPQTGVKYSTITYMTTSDHQDGPKALITTDQEVSLKNDVTATKYSTSSLLLLDSKETLPKSKEIFNSGATCNETKFSGGQFLSSQNSPEEMTSWASDRDSSVRSIANDHETSYPMSKSPSDKLIVDSCSESDDGSRNCCNSLPITLNCELTRERRLSMNSTSKRPKRDETTPIISGGVSTIDFSKPTESPIVKRKTESTPIVSGGSVMMNEPRERVKTTRMASSMSAWVVDMSDCGKNGVTKISNDNSHTAMSQSFSSSDCVNGKNTTKAKTSEAKHSSLGFFVNLNDIDGPKEKHENSSHEMKKINTAETAKQSCEFFIDISDENKMGKNGNGELTASNGRVKNLGESSDKKNMFSMFIDLKKSSEKQPEEIRAGGSRLFDKRADARQTKFQAGDSGESSSSSQIDQSGHDHNSNGSERGKSGVFMFIESDSPVVRRRALSSSRPAFQRHSWNVDKTQLHATGNGHFLSKDGVIRREHKRAHSVSVDRADLRKLQTKSSNSSHSLSEVARADTLNGIAPRRTNEPESNRNTDTSTEEVFEYDVRDTPPNSHIETTGNEDLRGCVKQRDYKEIAVPEVPETAEIADTRNYEDECSEVSGWDKTGTESTEGHTRKSETFDISSGGSGPSPESDNHDFDLDDLRTGEMANYNEILQVEHPIVVSKVSETHKSLTETIKKIECELKKPEYTEYEKTSSDSLTPVSRKDTKSSSRGSKDGQTKAECTSFVRLSDLDKTPARSQTSDVNSSRDDKIIYRMSNSIPETSWVESKLAMNRTNCPIRPLPRKFASIMSTSLPAKHKSPIEDADGETEGLISESDLSSMQSSMGRSGADVSTEETETSSMGVTKPCNRLGEDLLRMFLEEINPDVTIDISGRRIRAHKCILSSRCQYFAAILSGGWIESAGNVISLQGYSYNAVHFALCHIYSGESNIPDTLSIVELATLADMLCLEGLKEVIGYTLKVKYCHLFHKPCQICAVGVLECMPLAAAYGLDEVYRKSLRWITRHFVRIWPCKAFATLPRELMDKCYHQHIVHMSTDNVLQTMMDCDKLLATLPNVRWAEPVFRMVSNLLETAVKFISENFSGVLANENFQALGRDLTWNISRLEDNFLAAADRLPPDQACKSYSKLNKMLAATQVEEPLAKPPWGPLFVDFLRKIQSRVEKCLVKEASRAARTTTWLKMDLELRRRIQELACLVILPHEALKRPSRHSNFLKEPRVPSARAPASRSLDLRRVKMAISEHSDKTTKHTTTVTTTTSAPGTTQQVKKNLLVKPKSDPLERKIPQEEKQVVSDSVALRPKSWPNKLEVKSRYLEPRNKSVTKETAQQAQHERVIVQQRRKIMISSSDSSRTSSPAMKRAIDKKPIAKMKLTIKKDVKALSSDSLAEATSSTKTGAKKDPISKSCGITRPESPSFKQKDADIGISADSLAEPKKKQQQQQQQLQQQQPITKKKQPGKMDTSMSADSLMADIGTTPKSTNLSNKVSPTMGRAGTANKTQAYDRVKKSSPPMQQKSPATTGRRLPRSLECSTAASRNRAVAISAYHGSPNLRRNLLDAAKTPDVPAKTLNGPMTSKSSPRQQNLPATVTSTTSSFAKRDKKESLSNQTSTESPSKKSSPKSNGTHRTNRATSVTAKRPVKAVEERAKTKCHNGDTPKQPTVGSRSGTFLKDEPTILKKTDIKAAQISGS